MILDEFSSAALAWEWDQVAVGPRDWQAAFEAIPPQLLFVESAWQGNGGAWRGAMSRAGGPDQRLRDLVAWCRERGVPTVFWNKEDPPNYEMFIEAARLFDHVLTVDEQCLPRYRADLGHDRVATLRFGAQPRLHNPVGGPAARRLDVAFAGTYFRDKHDTRREQMDVVLGAAAAHGLHIYSRMAGGPDRYQFPTALAGSVVGSLTYAETLQAYHSYRCFLNVNSVTESPSTCARRVFELSACATPVLSGPSRAIEETFGDLVAVATTRDEASDHLRAILASPELRDRRAHLAHRLVMDRHTYRSRVSEVLERVGLPDTAPRPACVSVLVSTRRPHRLDDVLRTVAAQQDVELELVLVQHGEGEDGAEVLRRARELGLEQVEVVPADATLTLGACLNRGLDACSGDLVAKFDDDNFYAPRYLADLVLPFGYTDAGVVGKWAHYVHLEASDATVLRFADWEHRYSPKVQGGTMLMQGDLVRRLRFADLPRGVDTAFLRRCADEGTRVYSADRYNFVSRRGSDRAGHTWDIDDTALLARSSRVAFYGAPEGHVRL